MSWTHPRFTDWVVKGRGGGGRDLTQFENNGRTVPPQQTSNTKFALNQLISCENRNFSGKFRTRNQMHSDCLTLKIHRNVIKYLPVYTACNPSNPELSSTPLWETQISHLHNVWSNFQLRIQFSQQPLLHFLSQTSHCVAQKTVYLCHRHN